MSCRTKGNKDGLIRVVRQKDGTVVLDETGRMNGRGAYLCRNAECLKKAVKTGVLSRALKVQLPDRVYEELSAAIASDRQMER